MSTETKVLIGVGITTVAIFAVGIFFMGQPVSTDVTKNPTADESVLERPDSFVQGPKGAKVTVVEFADFQCPACKQAYITTAALKDEYKDKVKFVFKHYPLQQHKNAMIAALASEAAGEQGKFWEMHDMLFEKQEHWAEEGNAREIFIGYAKDLKLNTDKFTQDLNSEKLKNKINRDEQDGVSVALRYTPTFYINGHKLEGASTYNDLKSNFDKLLNE